jgi:hypothetical protein
LTTAGLNNFITKSIGDNLYLPAGGALTGTSLTVGSNAITAGSLVLGGNTLTSTQVGYLAGTAGNTLASQAVITDSGGNAKISGTFSAVNCPNWASIYNNNSGSPLLTMSFDPIQASSSITIGQMSIHFSAINLQSGQSYTGVSFYSAFAASVGNVCAGVYNAAGERLATTATSNPSTTITMVSLNFTPAFSVTSSGIYYVAVLATNGSGYSLQTTSTSPLTNAGVTFTSGKLAGRCCRISTTSLPATLAGLTPTSLSNVPWVALY